MKLQAHKFALGEEKIKDQRKVVVLLYLDKIVEMFRNEFDLKASLSMQIAGVFKKRKLLTYVWVSEPHIDENFLDTLPKSIEN